MLEKIVLAVLVAFSLISLYGAQERGGRNRVNRRQRILSILEAYQEPTAPTFHAARYSFEVGGRSGGRSGVASDRAISHYTSGWNGRGPSPNRTTPPPTVEPPESSYDLWYYQVTFKFRFTIFKSFLL